MKTKILSFCALIFGNALFSQEGINSEIFENYLYLKEALVLSDQQQAGTAAARLLESLENAELSGKNRTAINLVRKIVQAGSLDEQRTAFADLTPILWERVEKTKGLKQDVYLQYCPMKKASWLSDEAGIRNPFYGSRMLTCGTVSATKKQ